VAAISLLPSVAEQFAEIDEWSADSAKAALGEVAKAASVKPGALMFPLRVALSGRGHGPDLGDILDLLGKDRATRRVRQLAEMMTAPAA